jgi:hypothetical protein
MRYHDILNERWFNTYKVGEAEVDVYKNPSKAEFFKTISTVFKKHGEPIEWPLRAFVLENDFYMWDAYYATHSDMNDKIPSAGGYVYLNKSNILLNDLNWEYSETSDAPLYGHWVRTYYNNLIQNPFIASIYGSSLSIIGRDDDGAVGPKGTFQVTQDFIDKYVE